MFKKVTITVFILVANIILMMHAIFPHHHHETQVFFVLTHCHSHDAQSDNDHEKKSGNGPEGDTHDCVLRHVVALVDKTSMRASDALVDAYQILSEFALVAFDNLLDEPEGEWVLWDQADKAFSFPNYVSSSLGLRAPPSV